MFQAFSISEAQAEDDEGPFCHECGVYFSVESIAWVNLPLGMCLCDTCKRDFMRKREAQAYTQAEKVRFMFCDWSMSLAVHYKGTDSAYGTCGYLGTKQVKDPLKVNCRNCIQTMMGACVKTD
jgi:hypothetical protein